MVNANIPLVFAKISLILMNIVCIGNITLSTWNRISLKYFNQPLLKSLKKFAKRPIDSIINENVPKKLAADAADGKNKILEMIHLVVAVNSV